MTQLRSGSVTGTSKIRCSNYTSCKLRCLCTLISLFFQQFTFCFIMEALFIPSSKKHIESSQWRHAKMKICWSSIKKGTVLAASHSIMNYGHIQINKFLFHKQYLFHTQERITISHFVMEYNYWKINDRLLWHKNYLWKCDNLYMSTSVPAKHFSMLNFSHPAPPFLENNNSALIHCLRFSCSLLPNYFT